MTTLYFVTADGSVYSTSVETPSTSLLFRCFIDSDQPVIGIASTATQIVLLKNIGQGSSRVARLVFYGRNYQYLKTVDIPVSLPVADLAFWPGNPQRLLTSSSDGIYVLALDSISSRFIPLSITRGIAAVMPGDLNPVITDFYIGRGKIDGYINQVTINSATWTVTAQAPFARRLHAATSGLAVPQGELTPKVYAVNPEGGQSALHSFTQGIPTTGSIKIRLAELPCVAVGLDAPMVAGTSPVPTITALPTITTLQYAIDGSAVAVDGVNFGIGAPTMQTVTSCISLKVNAAIANVKIGLLEADSPSSVLVSHKSVWDPEMQPLIPPGWVSFPGLSDGTPNCPNNVSVGTQAGSDGVVSGSDYVYLAVSVPSGYFKAGRTVFKWFFDFE